MTDYPRKKETRGPASPPPRRRGSQAPLFISKVICSFARGPVRGWWVLPEFCFQPNFCLKSPRPVALGQCWEGPLCSRLVPVWTLSLDSAARSTLSFGETGVGRVEGTGLTHTQPLRCCLLLESEGNTVDSEGRGHL